MNHDANQAAVVIGAVVERCSSAGVTLVSVSIDEQLADALSLADGGALPHGDRPRVGVGLGSAVIFQRADEPA